MSMKWSIQAGCFRDDFTIAESLDRDAIAAILIRFVDRDDGGVPGSGRQNPRFTTWEVLGYIEREAVLLRAAGVGEVNLIECSPRLVGFLVALCRELRCRLLDPNNGEWVTDYFVGLADGCTRRVEPAAAPDAGRRS